MDEFNDVQCGPSQELSSLFLNIEFHQVEHQLMNIQYQLEKGNNLDVILQSTSDLLNQLERLKLCAAEIYDPFKMNQAEDLRSYAAYLLNEIKLKINYTKRSRPVVIAMDDVMETEEQSTPQKRWNSRDVLKEMASNLVNKVTDQFSKLIRREYPASIRPLHCNQKI